MEEAKIIEGNIAVDDRGSLSFVNKFDFLDSGIKRFYTVQNHQVNFIRAYHGHKLERKYVFVPQGTILINLISMEELDNRNNLPNSISIPNIYTFILSDKKPNILCIPARYYNGFKTLTSNTIIQFFSTSSLEESKGDDYRQPWNILGTKSWNINYR